MRSDRASHRALRGEPLLGFRQPAADQHAGARAPGLAGPHEAAALEHRDVLHEGRQRHRERRRQHGYGLLAAAERADDRAARRVGQRME